MPGKSPHAHERPAWHTPAQHPCTGQRPGAAARPHPRGMSFCPSKAISHPVPKPRLRGLSRAMAPRPSLPTGTLRANAFPVPRETRGKSPRREPTDHIQRRKPHQKPRVERARGLSLARHPRSHQQTTLRAAKETGIPQSAGASPQRRTRPSLPTGTLRANASRPPRNAQQKGPVGASRPRPTQKAPSKAACRKSARPFLGPPSPQPSTNDSSRRKRNGHPPKRRRILPKANAPVPPHRGPPRERLPSPANRAAKKAPWEPTDRVQCRAAFSLSSPCLSRNTAANGHAPWEERGLFASTRAVSPAGRF